MTPFAKLEVWKLALALVKEIYAMTSHFPSSERFGITDQIRRASVSVLANIAEGSGRYTFADKAAKYVIARGELSEIDALLIVSGELKFGQEQVIKQLLERTEKIGRMLSGLIAGCRKRQLQNP